MSNHPTWNDDLAYFRNSQYGKCYPREAIETKKKDKQFPNTDGKHIAFGKIEFYLFKFGGGTDACDNSGGRVSQEPNIEAGSWGPFFHDEVSWVINRPPAAGRLDECVNLDGSYFSLPENGLQSPSR